MQIEATPITGHEDQANLSPVQRALVEFYAAFNSRDVARMAQNWAHEVDVAMDNPLGGIKRGWDDIEAVYTRIFHGPTQVYVEFYDYSVHESEEMFYVVGRERGWLHRGETRIDLAIRTSRIFRRVNGQWKQVHHHGSIDDAALLAQYQAAVAGA